VSAGLLAYIVLYNLNNINITERRRELATLKVLGFYPMEVASYVYRENVFLTICGVLLGMVFGIFLHRFVVLTLEVDIMMFGRTIHPASYVYSVLITFLFAIFVNGLMYFNLKKIDMVESLKSVE
jgi:putative ABC transport system permease protein